MGIDTAFLSNITRDLHKTNNTKLCQYSLFQWFSRFVIVCVFANAEEGLLNYLSRFDICGFWEFKELVGCPLLTFPRSLATSEYQDNIDEVLKVH